MQTEQQTQGRQIGHLHDDVTRAVHYGCSSKMTSGSSEAGGFTCCVPGCYNNSKKHKGKFSFYNFPGDQTLRRQWLHNISRKDFRPTTGHRVCSAHFEGGSFENEARRPQISKTKHSISKTKHPNLAVLYKHETNVNTAEIKRDNESNAVQIYSSWNSAAA